MTFITLNTPQGPIPLNADRIAYLCKPEGPCPPNAVDVIESETEIFALIKRAQMLGQPLPK